MDLKNIKKHIICHINIRMLEMKKPKDSKKKSVFASSIIGKSLAAPIISSYRVYSEKWKSQNITLL